MWHEITEQLASLTQAEIFDEGSDLITLFEGFLNHLNWNINQLSFIRIAENCARQYTDLEAAITFMKEQEEKLTGALESDGALLFCKISQAEKRLNQGKYNDCQDLLEEVEEKLKPLNDVHRIVYSYLYKVTATFYRRKEDFNKAYDAGL